MNNVKNHPKAKGEKTQLIVLAKLVSLDYIVLSPYGDNQRYDFAIDLGDRFVRLQCKTGKLSKIGAITFNVCSTQSNTKGHKSRSYHGEIDGFIVYCPDNDKVYIVPIAKVGIRAFSLRVNPPKKKQNNINWAIDYELKADGLGL